MRPGDRIVLDAVRATGAVGWGMLVVAVVDPLTRLALPAALAGALDATLGAGPDSGHLVLLGALLGLATANEVAREVLETRSEARGALSLRRRILLHTLALGVGGKQRFATGDVLGRASSVTKVTASGAGVLVMLGTSLVTSFGGLIALFLIDVWLGVVFLAGVPAMWSMTRWLVRSVATQTGDYQRAYNALSARFVDAVRGARTIRASGTVDREVERVLAPLPELAAAGHDFWSSQRKVGWQAGLFAPVLQILVLMLAGCGVLWGRVSPGELIASQVYLVNAMGLLKQVAVLARWARARGAAHLLHEVLDQPAPRVGTRSLPEGHGALSLSGVHVVKGGHAILRGVDLSVPAGCAVAIVGASGAGKSTLTEVAGGLVTPDSGTVTVDGVPLDELKPDELRRAVTYAFERPNLLGETVLDFVAYSDRPAGREQVSAALADVAADSFVRRLPYGWHTPLRDLRLSGGELQRLGLARMAWRDARIVVLDDATSNVDVATEAEISAALDRSFRGSTRLIVAHRPATAAHADLVAWLDEGSVRAFAPHHELMLEPAYRAVFRHDEEADTIAGVAQRGGRAQ